MYLDFEDDHPDIPRVGSALSWRTQAACTVAAHVLAFLGLSLAGRVISATPQAVVTPADQQQPPPGETRFVFVAPRVDKPAPTPPKRAPLSDENRIARTREKAPAPSNPLPFSRGNTWEQVERQAEPSRGKPDAPEQPSPESRDAASPAPPSPEERSAPPLPESQSARVITPPAGDRGSRGGGLPRGTLGDALRHLDRYVQTDQFENARGGDAPYGSDIQFNTYGIDFGRWIRRFKAQVEGNWGPLIPQAVMFNHGKVVITFNVHKDGRISDVEVVSPAQIEGFNFAARGAITASNPTVPLPPEYPIDKAFFTVTFYYNERPPF